MRRDRNRCPAKLGIRGAASTCRGVTRKQIWPTVLIGDNSTAPRLGLAMDRTKRSTSITITSPSPRPSTQARPPRLRARNGNALPIYLDRPAYLDLRRLTVNGGKLEWAGNPASQVKLFTVDLVLELTLDVYVEMVVKEKDWWWFWFLCRATFLY